MSSAPNHINFFSIVPLRWAFQPHFFFNSAWHEFGTEAELQMFKKAFFTLFMQLVFPFVFIFHLA
jgi:hypothetical protein